MIKRSEIILKNVQFKSIEKVRKVCKALNDIEEESFIKVGKITIENSFVCPWINFDELRKTEMEKLISSILKKIS